MNNKLTSSRQHDVYILPRNRALMPVHHRQQPYPVQQQQVQRSSRLTNQHHLVRVARPQLQHHRELQPMSSARHLYLASSAVANPPVVMPKLAAPRHAPQPIYKMAPEQSEEDEIDVEEVYQLLEESAGHRLLESPGPRRRERLTNLTPEEKLNRRKQKNRVAAQAARDRKKETTKRLEDSLRKALLEIGRLKGEVKYLRVENGQLRAENQAIRFAPAPAPPVKPEHDFEQHHVQRPQFGQQSNNNIASIKSAPMAHPQQQPHAGMAAGTDSLGSAAGAGIQVGGQVQQQQPKWAKQQQQQTTTAGHLHDQGANGPVVGDLHGEGDDDFKLHQIFDELFEELDVPVDVDQFCNEIIEEGIAAQNVAHGCGQAGAAEQKFPAAVGRPIAGPEGGQPEGPGPAERLHQRNQFPNHFGLGGGPRGGGGHCTATAEAALSPHNYYATPTTTTSGSRRHHHHQQPQSISSSDSQSDNGLSPSYHHVPSPISSHIGMDSIDAMATDFEHHGRAVHQYPSPSDSFLFHADDQFGQQSVDFPSMDKQSPADLDYFDQQQQLDCWSDESQHFNTDLLMDSPPENHPSSSSSPFPQDLSQLLTF